MNIENGSPVRSVPPRGALLAIGLDHADELRLRYGAGAVEAVLAAAARQIGPCIPAADLRAAPWRSGDDGLQLFAPDLADADAACAVARRLQDRLPSRLAADDAATPRLSWSVGVACGPAQAVDVSGRAGWGLLQRQAAAALDRARWQGRAGVVVCDARLARQLEDRARVVAELPQALARGDLLLHYQPQFAVADGRLVGLEALVRWHHPQQGLVMPDAFVGHAEAAGLIDELGDWVLHEACRQASRWQRLGLPRVPMAVNVSGRQLQQADFPRRVRAALAAADLAPELLELELTESSLLLQPDAALRLLGECRRLGVRVALDDFGTGQSGLALLRRVGVDRLKIDRSFFAGLPGEAAGEAIVRLVVELAHALGLEAVAEGIETEAQLALLRRLGCHAYQGHLRAAATPSPQAEQALRRVRSGAG